AAACPIRVQELQGNVDGTEHHSCVVLDMPRESKTYLPAGSGLAFLSTGWGGVARARAAAGVGAGMLFVAVGYGTARQPRTVPEPMSVSATLGAPGPGVGVGVGDGGATIPTLLPLPPAQPASPMRPNTTSALHIAAPRWLTVTRAHAIPLDRSVTSGYFPLVTELPQRG